MVRMPLTQKTKNLTNCPSCFPTFQVQAPLKTAPAISRRTQLHPDHSRSSVVVGLSPHTASSLVARRRLRPTLRPAAAPFGTLKVKAATLQTARPTDPHNEEMKKSIWPRNSAVRAIKWYSKYSRSLTVDIEVDI